MILRADLDFLLGCGGNNELNHIIRAMLQAKGKNGRKNNFADKIYFFYDGFIQPKS